MAADAGFTRFLAAFTAGQLGSAAEPGAVPTLAAGASFAQVVLAVDALGSVVVDRGAAGCARIGRGDLDDLLVRAWLFGIITQLERRLRADLVASEAWGGLLSPERLARARELKEERQRRGQAAATIACLQFGDLGKIGIRSAWWQRLFGGSNRQHRETVKRLEGLRNNLAHGQALVDDWETIVVIASQLERLASGADPVHA